MKKLIALVCAGFICASVFAGKIPAGRKLLPLAVEFAHDTTNSWTAVETADFDPKADTYVITGFAVNKNFVGFIKQTYTVTLQGNGGDFTVTVTDMNSVACDKAGNKTSGATTLSNPAGTMKKLAGLIDADLSKRIKDWKDDEYTKKYDSAVTDPMVLNSMANKSALVFKKFISDNQLIGKAINLKINVTKVDEAPKYEKDYAYYIGGVVLVGYKPDGLGINFPEWAHVMIYTNNEAAIELEPVDLLNAVLASGQPNSVYEVKGTIKDVTRREAGGLSIIEIRE